MNGDSVVKLTGCGFVVGSVRVNSGNPPVGVIGIEDPVGSTIGCALVIGGFFWAMGAFINISKIFLTTYIMIEWIDTLQNSTTNIKKIFEVTKTQNLNIKGSFTESFELKKYIDGARYEIENDCAGIWAESEKVFGRSSALVDQSQARGHGKNHEHGTKWLNMSEYAVRNGKYDRFQNGVDEI